MQTNGHIAITTISKTYDIVPHKQTILRVLNNAYRHGGNVGEFDGALFQLRVHGKHLGGGAEPEAGHRGGQVQDRLLGTAWINSIKFN